ncbi:hypothetical protein [Streptomyces sp. S.PB5]|uniref:DUF7715 family protein n=1 Tax=Streptomyces sp. S.PB5 TaxID=3020844 RepID=UPI0025B047DD|nr:hypothetical protein [Streptomyces sp. S.PB5]MDN3023821.1 hypothetical protein [Streptomyces sp. S.PB5]
MLVLAAPRGEDPRDGGFVHTVAGELVIRPFVCGAGEHGACGCERSWAGVTSYAATTLVEVVDRPDLTPATYADLIARYFTDVWQWKADDAREEAQELADIADDFGPGALLYIEGEYIHRLEPRP